MNAITERYYFQRFVDELFLGKALTDRYISHCHKSIFKYIANSEVLKRKFPKFLLCTLEVDGKVKSHYIKNGNEELDFNDLMRLPLHI